MRLLVDSREKWTQSGSTDTHLSSYFARHGIAWTVQALSVGDYQIDGDPSVSVDRKKSLDELATNLLNRSDSCRFWREVRRSYSQGTKLIVLCECGGQYHTVNDLKAWKSRYSGVSGRRLIDEIVRCERAYGVRFMLCDKRSTARLIIELLTNGGYTNAETKTKEQHGGGDAN